MLKKLTRLSLLILIVSACDNLGEYRNKSDIYLYTTAMNFVKYSRHQQAAKVFEEVDLQHPASSLAPKSLVMAGYCFYLESSPVSRDRAKFPQAIDHFESFLRLHPYHELVPYAIYMTGICYFEMFGDEKRDQNNGDKALNIFENLIKRFPNSPYSKDAQEKIDVIKLYKIKKNIYIAESLIADRHYAPAIRRLQKVIAFDKLNNELRNKARELLNFCYQELKIKDTHATNNLILPK